MNCPQCNMPINQSARFCGGCGTKINKGKITSSVDRPPSSGHVSPVSPPLALPVEIETPSAISPGHNHSRHRGAGFHILLGMAAMALFIVAVAVSALAISYFAAQNDWFRVAEKG